MAQKKITIHWFGSPYTKLDPPFQHALSTYFTIRDFGMDISELTNPNVTHACFYSRGINVQSLLQLVTKMCHHLKKLLIIFYDGRPPVTSHFPSQLLVKNVNTCHQNYQRDILALYQLLNQSQPEKHSAPQILQPGTLPAKKDQTDTPTLRDTIDYIDHHFTDKLPIEHLAERMNCSIFYFSRQFHRQVGICFQDYIINKRIALAKQLLTETLDEKISAIAYLCGYRDISYFSRIFKKRTGMTPQQYREKQLHMGANI